LVRDLNQAWSGAALAIESDTGRVMLDMDGDFSTSTDSFQIGMITPGQVAGIVSGNLAFIA
jgi:hypothetical protein